MNKLTVTLPYIDEDTVSNIERIVVHESYTKQFWRSLLPPHKVVYIFNGLSDEGIEAWKSKFRDTAKIYIEPKMLSYCRFDVASTHEQKQ